QTRPDGASTKVPITLATNSANTSQPTATANGFHVAGYSWGTAFEAGAESMPISASSQEASSMIASVRAASVVSTEATDAGGAIGDPPTRSSRAKIPPRSSGTGTVAGCALTVLLIRPRWTARS